MPRYGSGGDLARELGITRQAVHKAERSGRISRTADGRFDLDAAKIQYRLHTDPEQQLRSMQQHRSVEVLDPPVAPTFEGDAKALVAAKARRESAEAQKAELELAEMQGRILDVSDHKRVVFGLCRSIRDALLPIPDRLTPILAAEMDPQKVHVTMATEIRQVLNMLAKLGDTRQDA